MIDETLAVIGLPAEPAFRQALLTGLFSFLAVFLSALVAIGTWFATRRAESRAALRDRQNLVRDIATSLWAELEVEAKLGTEPDSNHTWTEWKDAANAGRLPFIPVFMLMDVYKRCGDKLFLLPAPLLQTIVEHYSRSTMYQEVLLAIRSEQFKAEPAKSQIEYFDAIQDFEKGTYEARGAALQALKNYLGKC